MLKLFDVLLVAFAITSTWVGRQKFFWPLIELLSIRGRILVAKWKLRTLSGYDRWVALTDIVHIAVGVLSQAEVASYAREVLEGFDGGRNMDHRALTRLLRFQMVHGPWSLVHLRFHI